MRLLELFQQIDFDELIYHLNPQMVERVERHVENCSQILKIYSQTQRVLYRGISGEASDIFFGRSPVNRTPVDTSPELHNLINKKLREFGFIACRDNSIFTSSHRMTADYYGSMYVIFPLDGFDYTWSPKIRDFFNEISGYGEYDIKTDNLENMTRKDFEKTFGYIQNQGIDVAIATEKEVMIRGQYLAISVNHQKLINTLVSIRD